MSGDPADERAGGRAGGEERGDEEREWLIRRILVALDASPHSLAALEAAVELAASASAELLGMFVEDENLLRLAELPFARETGLYSGAQRPVERLRMERQLRARARAAEQALATLAGRAQVHYTFRVTRGLIEAEIEMAAADVDLISLGRSGWSLAGRRRIGSTARAVAVRSPHPTLILQHGARLGVPVVVVFDGSAPGWRALVAAARLAEAKAGPLLVLTVAGSPDEAVHFPASAAAWLEGRGLEARFGQLTAASVDRLAARVRAEGGGTLVLPAETALLHDEALLALVAELNSAVLIVR